LTESGVTVQQKLVTKHLNKSCMVIAFPVEQDSGMACGDLTTLAMEADEWQDGTGNQRQSEIINGVLLQMAGRLRWGITLAG
jgi:hypothetical protein